MNDADELLSICFVLKEYARVTPKLFQQLLLRYGDPRNILGAGADELSATTGLNSARSARLLKAAQKLSHATRELASLAEQGINVYGYFSPAYPDRFRVLDEPPVLFYLRGDPDILSAGGVAIVGTTAADQDGLRAAVDFAKAVATAGRTVISGLAAGIDSAAHLGALKANGLSIAVLGCGLRNIYPQENAPLAEMVCSSGALVTEYRPSAAAVPANLIARNRLIAALADVVLVVQIGQSRRGELHAAAAAIRQGKPLFVYNGPGGELSRIPAGISYVPIADASEIDNLLAYAAV